MTLVKRETFWDRLARSLAEKHEAVSCDRDRLMAAQREVSVSLGNAVVTLGAVFVVVFFGAMAAWWSV
ncbi:MAG: hypothetical protein KC561_01295 [Myxococcales bacterium]|nr:hypothetical protein [Myxococcales bacterium]